MVVSLQSIGGHNLRGGLDCAFPGVRATETGHECWASALDDSVATT